MESDRCPLCGGRAKPTIRNSWVCDECDLPERHWPRIRELVAIRDAAVELASWRDLHPSRFDEVMARIEELARQEDEHGKA